MYWRLYCTEDTSRTVTQTISGHHRRPYNNKVINETPQMSTRSRVGLELADGSILSSYHHSNGYPSWLGRILTTHYNSKELASDLIDGGDMSCAWTIGRWTNDLPDHHRQTYGPQYYSQRGEECPPRLDADLCEYLLPDGSEEYAYVFRSGEWVCYNMHQFDDNRMPEVVEIPAPVAA